jgi:hypothetical protein
MQAYINELETEIDGFWEALLNGYNVESRKEIQEDCEASWAEGTSPLAVALHFVWKREPKVAELEAKVARLTSRGIEDMQFTIKELEAWYDSLMEHCVKGYYKCAKCGGPVRETLCCAWCETDSPEYPASKAGDQKKEGCRMPLEMKSHWFKHCDSDKPTANCLMCGNWKGTGVSFLPDCKWQRNANNVTYCTDTGCKLFDKPCSKRCDCPEPEVKEYHSNSCEHVFHKGNPCTCKAKKKEQDNE